LGGQKQGAERNTGHETFGAKSNGKVANEHLFLSKIHRPVEEYESAAFDVNLQ